MHMFDIKTDIEILVVTNVIISNLPLVRDVTRTS